MITRVLIVKVALIMSLWCSPATLMAQNGWHYLPNVGLGAPSTRFEDVYFTDTSTGYAVFIPSLFASSNQKQIY